MSSLEQEVDRLRTLAFQAQQERTQQQAKAARAAKDLDAWLATMRKGGIFCSAMRQAYVAWLQVFVGAGGKPTHYYDYPQPANRLFVAQDDFEMRPLRGAQAIQVIVPPGVQFLGGDLGHSNLYIWDPPSVQGLWVPVYSDTSPS